MLWEHFILFANFVNNKNRKNCKHEPIRCDYNVKLQLFLLCRFHYFISFSVNVFYINKTPKGRIMMSLLWYFCPSFCMMQLKRIRIMRLLIRLRSGCDIEITNQLMIRLLARKKRVDKKHKESFHLTRSCNIFLTTQYSHYIKLFNMNTHNMHYLWTCNASCRHSFHFKQVHSRK